MMIGDDKWSMMKTVAMKLERWLTTARQGYMPLVDSDRVPKFVKPVRNRRAVALSYPAVKPPGSFTVEILPETDGTGGRRARLRQRVDCDDDDRLNGNEPVKNDEPTRNKISNGSKKNRQKNILPRHLSSFKNNNLTERLTVPKNEAAHPTTPKRTFTGGRRAVLKQQLTPTGELYSYTTPHKCYICGKTCYLPFTYQPFIRMNNDYIEVTQYSCDGNVNVIDERDVVTVINAEREYRYRKDLNPRTGDDSDLPIIVLAFDSEIRSSKV